MSWLKSTNGFNLFYERLGKLTTRLDQQIYLMNHIKSIKLSQSLKLYFQTILKKNIQWKSPKSNPGFTKMTLFVLCKTGQKTYAHEDVKQRKTLLWPNDTGTLQNEKRAKWNISILNVIEKDLLRWHFFVNRKMPQILEKSLINQSVTYMLASNMNFTKVVVSLSHKE
jgi:hypothetical protein